MKMTIEQDIKVIRKMLACTDLRARENLHADMIDACEDAIATMRKYQKIENIIKNAGVFAFNVPEIRRIAEVMDIDTLLEIADKYQKIEQILSDWINDDSVGMSDYWMGRIKEVVKDE